MEFKDRLKALRKEKGISGEVLGKAVGVNKASISNWETGRNFPETKSLQMLADYFEVSVDYLIGIQTISDYMEATATPVTIDVTGLPEEDIALVSLIVQRLKGDYKKDG